MGGDEIRRILEEGERIDIEDQRAAQQRRELLRARGGTGERIRTMAADPSTWNRLGALEPEATTRGTERQIVPGVPAVVQPIQLARDEWVCGGCGAPVSEDGANGFRMVHQHGCSAVASIVQQVQR